jgi:peptidyl-prolyl cis-trans isomerase A (cyclophilin A)
MTLRYAAFVAPRRMAGASYLLIALAAGACAKEQAALQDSAPPADPIPAAAAPDPDPVAPDSFKVAFETSVGGFDVMVYRAWSPLGADRFHRLVSEGYFTDTRFFRVMPGFIAQFGMHGDPATNARWKEAKIMDEPVKTPNAKGTIVFAKPSMPANSRSNQFFINLGDNSGSLDAMGFSPFGKVVRGMDVVEKVYGGYGETPDQGLIGAQGNAYLTASFPKLDYIKSAVIK